MQLPKILLNAICIRAFLRNQNRIVLARSKTDKMSVLMLYDKIKHIIPDG